MDVTLENLGSSMIYILIWISFWGIIETTITHFCKDFSLKLRVYSAILLVSCFIYVIILKKEIDIKMRNQRNYPNDLI